jgi:hypothetical protein
MSNIKVSSDIDTFLRKSTKEEAATFLGLEDTKAQWGQITGTLTTQSDLASALNSKADTSNPTFIGNVTAPTLTTSEVQAIAGEAIEYDSKEHRFRDEDEQPNNLLVIKKEDGIPIGKVGINHTNPKVALHVVGGHVSAGGMTDEALRVVGSALFTSDNATALVVAMDTDNTASTSDPIIKLKRDERASATGDVEEMNLGFVGSDSLYADQTSDSAYLQVEKDQFFEIATGTVPKRRLQVNTSGVDIKGDLTLADSASSVGIRTTSAPTAALDVNGTIKGNEINIDNKGFFVPENASARYLQAADYGIGGFSDLTGTDNQPKSTASFGKEGKILERSLIRTYKLTGTGFTGLGTPVELVPAAGSGKFIVPLGMTVLNKFNSRAGEWGTTGSAPSVQVGTFQNSDNTGNFSPWLLIPVSTAETASDWLVHKQSRNIENKIFPNRALTLRGVNYPSSEANAPLGQWFLQVEYMILDESNSFSTNVATGDTIGTAF